VQLISIEAINTDKNFFMIKALNFMKWITFVNCKNSIYLLTSFGINEEENKNAATKKALTDLT